METPLPDPNRPALRPLGPLGTLGPLSTIGSGGARLPVVPTPAPRREVSPNATLVAREDLTPSVARFTVKPDSGVPPFKPGQYFAIGLTIEGTLLQRPYSTASVAGGSDELEFLIRRVATGTFTPRFWETPLGSRLWIGPPKGLFTLRAGDRRTHLFISTGTGLAPFISMTGALLGDGAPEPGDGAPGSGAGDRPRIVVLHGASYAAELAYRDRLEAWQAAGCLAYVPTLSRPADTSNAGWTGATGRAESVLARVCDELGIQAADTVAYICGNPEMIEVATGVLRGLGFPDEAVIHEHYWTSTGPR